MRDRSTIVRFLKNLRGTIFLALLFVLMASAAWAVPTVTAVDPPDGTNPFSSTAVTATFSEPMDPATITSGSFTVSKSVKIKAIEAGTYHNVALKDDGTVAVWGSNNLSEANVPHGLSDVVAVSGGKFSSIALKKNGTVVAWGNNVLNSSFSERVMPEGLSGIVAISAGNRQHMVLKDDGTVVFLQNHNDTYLQIPGTSGVVAISAGIGNRTLALKNDGTVVGWVNGYYGQFDIPSGLSGVVAISAGYNHSLALKNDGTVVAWGDNAYGQLNVPSGLSGVVAIASGGYFSLALKNDGTVVGWGNNAYGQLDLPSELSGVVAISAGMNHCVALKNDGTAVGWGSNSQAQVTVPSNMSGARAIASGGLFSLALKNEGAVVAWGWQNAVSNTTVPPDLSGVVAISAGDAHSLAVKNDGTVVAWGENTFGQINLPSGLSGIVAVAGGSYHSLALKNDGTVVAWGTNNYNQIMVPPGLSGVVAVEGGYYHSLALKNDGTVAAWGYNGAGQLNVPLGLSGVVAISAGRYHSLALKNDGTVVAWGDNYYGQINLPSGLSGVVAISAGYYYSLALKNDGTIVGWGNNSLGSLKIPPGLSGVVAISAKVSDSIALKNDGTVVAIGRNIVPTSPYETIVPGSVVYDQTTNTATFTPSVPLEPGATYIGRVNTGVRSATGEHLVADVSWKFLPVQAPAAIVLAGITQVYDGTPKEVTATTDPAGLAVSITYNDSNTPPTAVGSYTVVATVNDAAYVGSATAILTITNPTFTISSAVVGGNGSISCDSPVNNGGNSICSVIPAANYHLATITDNNDDKLGSVTATGYTIGNVTADHTIQGTFAVNLTANAGPSQIVTCSGPTGAQVSLDGSASTGAATYTWSGPFGTATGVNPTVTVPWGTHTITLTVYDGTGKTASSFVVITAVDNVPPAVTITGITNGATYNLGLVPTASYSAVDAISGVETSSGTLTGGDAQGLGQFTYTVTATDKAGNTAITNSIYTVTATTTGTVTLIEQLTATGLVDSQTAMTLSDSIVTAMTFYESGNSTAGDNKVGAFINQVNAPGRNIPSEIVTLLINAANYIIAQN